MPQARPERVLLYIHGGGFVLRNAQPVRALRRTGRARARRACASRGLSPCARVSISLPPQTIASRRTAGCWKQGVAARSIVIAGDSAGANLTLVSLLDAKAAGVPQPACAFVLSPPVDLTMASAEPSSATSAAMPCFELATLVAVARAATPAPSNCFDPRGFAPVRRTRRFAAVAAPGRHPRNVARRCRPVRRACETGRGGGRTRAVARHAALLPVTCSFFPKAGKPFSRWSASSPVTLAGHTTLTAARAPADAFSACIHRRNHTNDNSHAKTERSGRTLPPHGSTTRGHACDDDLHLRPGQLGAATALSANHRASREAPRRFALLPPQDRAGADGAGLPVLGRRTRFDIDFHVRHLALPKPGDWRQFQIMAARIHARPDGPYAAAVGDVRDRRIGQRGLAAEGQLRARYQGPPRGGRWHGAG